MNHFAPILLFLLLPPVLGHAANPVVRVTTSLGAFDIELCSETSEVCGAAASNSVDNFLGYVDRGDYEGSLIHRSLPGFVIQGGGFRREGPEIIRAVPTPEEGIANEFGQSNVRGTVAIPLVGNGPSACDTDEDSGTSGWFVNIDDTNSSLDCGLFTVFGVVIGDGMQVVDAINQLPRLNINTPQLDPLFDPVALIFAFEQVPVSEEFFALFDPSPPDPLPSLEEFADAFLSTDITRVPEPAAGLGGATALVALATLGRRLRTP